MSCKHSFTFTVLGIFLPVFMAQAGTSAYKGNAGEKLYIQAAPTLGPKIFLIKFDGTSSKWNNKVVQTQRITSPNGDRYSFEYSMDLSSGVQNKKYQMVVDAGFDLIKGSRVKKIELWFPELAGKPLHLNYDEKLTESMQTIDLLAEHKKTNFTPEVN